MKFQHKLTVIGDAFNTQKTLAMPKKKFTFGNRAKNVKKKEEVTEVVVESAKKEEQKAEDMGNHLYFKDVDSGTITVKKEEYEGKENVDIQNIKNCTIIVPFPVKVVFMKNVQNCKLTFMAITASAHISNVDNSTLNMASH